MFEDSFIRMLQQYPGATSDRKKFIGLLKDFFPEQQMQVNLIRDILSDIEQLYRLSNKREVMKIQDEFLRIFHTKDIQKLERFQRELDIIAEGYRAQEIDHESGSE